MFYDFECENCQLQFEITCSMDSISGLKPKCPKCGKTKSVHRFWGNIYVVPPQHTLGSLAEKNSRIMSQDQRDDMYHKHTEYRRKPFEGGMPDGGKRKEEQ